MSSLHAARAAVRPRIFSAAAARNPILRRHMVSASASDGPSTSAPSPAWNIKMLYDGECPLCMREVDMLRRRDAGVGKIAFVDVAAADYDPSQHANLTFEQAMERIHAVLPDGTVITDVEVFRRLYEEVGLGWVYAVTKFPAAERAANALYNVWAKYRLQITGRPDFATVLAEKKMCRAAAKEGAVSGAAGGKN